LEILESRLGFRRVARINGEALEWFGRAVPLASLKTRSLGDEVGLEVSDWLTEIGVVSQVNGNTLTLRLPTPTVNNLRRGKGSTADRLVLDLNGPALVQQLNDDLLLELKVSPSQKRQLKSWGLAPQQRRDGGLVLRGQATKLQSLSLSSPWRLVLDGVRVGGRRQPPSARLPLSNPAVAALLRRGFVLEKRTIKVGVKPIQVFRAGGDLSGLGITLQPLAKTEQQQGLRFLPQLSQPAGALVAVNGGFFNRINQLPLGALRRQGGLAIGADSESWRHRLGIVRRSAVRPAPPGPNVASEQWSALGHQHDQQRLRPKRAEPLHTGLGAPLPGLEW
jgi:hypothetical protein